ncbi:hypothetical protein [Peterkaempfera sp. SMS 1(5)a]|uniref:hypothetical protein n=1 Tax=Peterkaempfera podocarpi TaxID=3232308 RepID=UPI00367268F8
MANTSYFGYSWQPEENVVLITYRCRTVCSVRGTDRIDALMRELRAGDRQAVLERWSADALATTRHNSAA